MSIFRRFTSVFQQKANAAADRLEDPAQALDLSYQNLLEEQQRMRRALVEATTGQKRLENQANDLSQRVQKLNAQAAAAVAQGRDDLATQALTQAGVLQAQRDQLVPQLDNVTATVAKLSTAVDRYQQRLNAFQTQRESLKAQYAASKATSQAGDSLAGIGEHMNDTTLMIARAQDKIAGMQAHADAVDSLLSSGALDAPGMGTDTLDQQLQATVLQNDVQQKLAALKASAGSLATGGDAKLSPAGIVVRIHGEAQYRLDPSLRDQLDSFDHGLVAALAAGDDATYHRTLGGLLALVRERGAHLPDDDIRPSDIVLPSDDMGVAEVNALLAGQGLVNDPAPAGTGTP